jgi:hypothetical protein
MAHPPAFDVEALQKLKVAPTMLASRALVDFLISKGGSVIADPQSMIALLVASQLEVVNTLGHAVAN